VLVLAVGAAAAAVSAAPAGAAPPSLRLVPTDPELRLTPRGGNVLLDLGVYVAAVDGDFELEVRRPDYDSRAEVQQVDAATKAPLQTLPPSVLRGWRGLRRFFHVIVTTPEGRIVLDRHFRFCPNGSDRMLVGDGEDLPRYADACRSDSPFVRGMVWGVQAEWAVAAFGFADDPTRRRYRVPLAAGRYVVRMEIAPQYQVLFGIPPDYAAVTLDLTVAKESRLGRRTHAPELEGHAAAPPGGEEPPLLPDPDPSLLPDLVALPAWNIELLRNNGRNYLGFAASAWNAGPGALVVEGFRRGEAPVMDAYQYFYDESLTTPVGRTAAGTLFYDSRQGHEHWHFRQFARYSLVSIERGTVLKSRKQSFCLAPTEPLDLTVPNAMWTPWSLTFVSVCGGRTAEWLREAMPVGWADTYYQVVAGQAFDVTALPNGRYAIEIQMNPLGVLHERSTANNVARRIVILRGTRAKRDVKVLPWHTITQ
jgi:hypothetical protein